MNVWTVAEAGSPSDIASDTVSDIALYSLSKIISHIGAQDFTSSVLREINRGLAAGSWSVYRTCGRRVPVCYLSNSYKRRDTTGSCFLAYRDGLYREDRTFDALEGSKGKDIRILHLTAADVRNPEHRRIIYEHHRLRERLSAARLAADGSILSVNLYRHDDQPAYRERDLQLFEHLARGLFASVERQIALQPIADGSTAAPATAGVELPEDAHREALRHFAPDMPPREVEVSLRLLRGMSHDGIACDLGIGATTVKTYRNRAFARLGIHHNNELFALALKHRDVSPRR
ncbi:helix-turn-helix transcriptional regulator [Noviherbaspirillum aerium]|uniref:helix-turn-helix transcriptional regulator n=1 Tax=Noviherbaspirillum aerium TaxID=2588497 RepID=UPI00124E3F28|nr:helix-turn-helix transcriptional regulator [Noviherbaspirillum aerium]